MRHCKHCNDTLFTDQYETCMTCYETHHTELPMKKCPNCETYAKNSETKSNIIGDLRSVLDKTLYELPVGYIPVHTYESIPEQVAYYVNEYTQLVNDVMTTADYIENVIPNFYQDTEDITMYNTTRKLFAILNKADLESRADTEALEALQGEIEMTYKYYAGFGTKKDLTATQMLNHILQTVPNYKTIKEEGHDLEDMKHQRDHYIKALEEITKKNRKAETCRMIALKALGELTDEDHQPELLIEENLALRMKVEDLESKIIGYSIDKVFPKEDEQKLLDNADKHSKMYP